MPRANNRTRLLSAFLLLVMLFGFAGVGPAAAAIATWAATGSLDGGRYEHTATLLRNGKVLVAGGLSHGSTLASAQVYDPAAGTWTATGSLSRGRCDHTATLLRNSKVFVAGGMMPASVWPVRRSMTRRQAPGPLPARWPAIATDTPPRCFQMAKCWSQKVLA